MNVTSIDLNQPPVCVTCKGFTLVEIMIVVVLIGILAAIAIPGFEVAKRNSIASVVANDLKKFSDGFEIYALERGGFPADKGPGVLPSEMDGYVGRNKFEATTKAGGNYDWDYGVFGVVAGVSVQGPTVAVEVMQKVDQILDDGNLAQGVFRSRSGGYIYVIDE